MFLRRRRGAGGTYEGGGASSDDEGPAGAAAAATGGPDGNDGGADDGGAAAAGGPAPGGAGGASPADTVGVSNPPSALNAVGQPPAVGMVAIFDARGETLNPTDDKQLRADLTAHVWSDRGELLAPYVVESSSMVTQRSFFPRWAGFFFP